MFKRTCSCCLSEGKFKNVNTEYKWLDDNEVYGKMLQECYGIIIADEKAQICGVCITRLRDATKFKRQVLTSQNNLHVHIKTEDMEEDVKMEIAENSGICMNIKLEEAASMIEQDDYFDTVSDTEDINLTRKSKAKKPSTSKVKIKAKLPQIPTKTKSISATRRNRMMKKNAITMLESSTVFPFKWHRQHYLCFYCHLPFKQSEDLRQHSLAEHVEPNVKSAVTYLRRDERVKIDVTNIKCKFCNTSIPDLKALKNHLELHHGKTLAEEFGDGVIPYKLQSDLYQCAVCGEKFQYFIKLNQHMNSHYDNYICESCGKSFLSRDRLRCHALSHGSCFKCTECGEIFDSITQRNNHCSKIHKKDKLLKCCYCDDTFSSYISRKKHYKTDHNIDVPEFKCPVCSKVFQIMSKMQIHVKEVHVREKNFSCNVCELKFFSKNRLKHHMVKHYGERVHQCEVCKKSYARKQTLRDHMRIHNNDKRFVCALCSLSFVQNNSLKLHMRVHHPDVGV